MIDWLTTAHALAIHDQLIAEHGGADGIRDINLLASALARPQQLFAYGQPEPDIAALAAAYAFGIAKNHAFVDGNKRTSAVVTEAFLRLNGLGLTATDIEIVQTWSDLGAGLITGRNDRLATTEDCERAAMSEQKPRVAVVGEVRSSSPARRTAGSGSATSATRSMSRSISRAAGSSGLCHRARRGSVFRCGYCARYRRGDRRRPDAADSRTAPWPRCARNRRVRRPPFLRMARRSARAGSLRAAALGAPRRRSGPGEARVFLRHHPLALFQCRARPFPCDPRSDPSQGRENRVRRKFPATRLARGPLSRAHRVHRSLEARRYRAADL